MQEAAESADDARSVLGGGRTAVHAMPTDATASVHWDVFLAYQLYASSITLDGMVSALEPKPRGAYHTERHDMGISVCQSMFMLLCVLPVWSLFRRLRCPEAAYSHFQHQSLSSQSSGESVTLPDGPQHGTPLGARPLIRLQARVVRRANSPNKQPQGASAQVVGVRVGLAVPSPPPSLSAAPPSMQSARSTAPPSLPPPWAHLPSTPCTLCRFRCSPPIAAVEVCKPAPLPFERIRRAWWPGCYRRLYPPMSPITTDWSCLSPTPSSPMPVPAYAPPLPACGEAVLEQLWEPVFCVCIWRGRGATGVQGVCGGGVRLASRVGQGCLKMLSEGKERVYGGAGDRHGGERPSWKCTLQDQTPRPVQVSRTSIDMASSVPPKSRALTLADKATTSISSISPAKTRRLQWG
ncbi:hypothetical protein JB92DRAFT_2827523 [Gautieria morchelliformis]|nr:hypothetical protein JB92DRAFT_2827523 [Gautieria morchelliformis]